jgi:hypothetical protein
MEQSPWLGLLFCCIIPILWSAGMIAVGIYYERYGFPYELRRRSREDDL